MRIIDLSLRPPILKRVSVGRVTVIRSCVLAIKLENRFDGKYRACKDKVHFERRK